MDFDAVFTKLGELLGVLPRNVILKKSQDFGNPSKNAFAKEDFGIKQLAF